jgi:hypothetical protein
LKPSLASCCIADQITHLLMQRGLVALDREQVVALLDDLGGNLALAAHGVDAHQQALDVQGFEQLRNGGDLVALAGDLLLAEHQSELGGEGADHVDRRRIAIGRAAQVLPSIAAIRPHRVRPTIPPTQRRNTASNCFGSSARNTRRKVSCDGMPFLSTRKRRSQSALSRPQKGDVLDLSASESMAHTAITRISRKSCKVPLLGLTRIFKLTEILHQTDSRSTHALRPKDESRRVFERVHKMNA